jgi:hypothetical protein
MKQSSRILLFSVAGILIVIVAMIVIARSMVGDILSGNGVAVGSVNRVELSGERDTEEFNLRDFDGVRTDGAWQLEIIEDDVYDVRITADTAVLERLSVEQENSSLVLSMPGNLTLGGLDVKAEVRMPAVRSIRVDGGADISVDGFTVDSLHIKSDGAANVGGVDNRIDTLYLETEGATNVDFRDSEVVNADVDIEGAGNVNLTMAGGRLTGVLAGIGQIHYEGEVTEESVNIRGLGGVEQR